MKMKIESLLSCECFHGDITADESYNLLHQQEIGHFLVRFSRNFESSFVISAVTEKSSSGKATITNYVVPYNPLDNLYYVDGKSYSSISQLLEHESEAKRLIVPLSNSTYSLTDLQFAKSHGGYEAQSEFMNLD